MPEFILDRGTRKSAATYASLDSFTQGYIQAVFFTNTGSGDDAENGLEAAHFGELAPSTLEAIRRDCRAFQAQCQADLDEACDNGRINGYDMEYAGMDFWYSRNGHGVGYSDRDLGDVGDKLQAIARGWHSRDLYRGDDGLIYLD